MTLLLALLLLGCAILLAFAWSFFDIQRKLNLHFQPWLEVLEDRTVLDTYYWTGAGVNVPGGNSFWSNTSNWWDIDPTFREWLRQFLDELSCLVEDQLTP